MKKTAILALFAAAALVAAPAHARVFVGIGIGIPIWGPAYYPYYGYPYYGYAPYYEPAPVVVRPQQQRYVEQPQTSGMWYYCAESKTYYPYVKDCPAGWQRVSPTPPR